MNDWSIRQATPEDVEGIAAAHLDSIQSLGSQHYPPHIVDEWGAAIAGEIYIQAMKRGEAFFVATRDSQILGFSTHNRVGDQHRTAVYVRGSVSRRGVGSALFRVAEARAIAANAHSIRVDASLAAVDFYRAQGFVHKGRGEHVLQSGARMDCVFMRKPLFLGGRISVE